MPAVGSNLLVLGLLLRLGGDRKLEHRSGSDLPQDETEESAGRPAFQENRDGRDRSRSPWFASERLPEGFDKLADAVAGQRVIINNRNQWNFRHPSLRRNVSQPTVSTKSPFVFGKFDLAQIVVGSVTS